MLAAMAEATKRVRIGLLVSGATYRHPGVLAKIATTVDHLSAGRLEFGIGSGWAENEHTMLGIPFHTVAGRIHRMEEAIEVCKRLWTEERATYEGKYFRLEDAIHEPKPIQKPYPPIWVGGSGEQLTLRVAAKHADEDPSQAAATRRRRRASRRSSTSAATRSGAIRRRSGDRSSIASTAATRPPSSTSRGSSSSAASPRSWPSSAVPTR